MNETTKQEVTDNQVERAQHLVELSKNKLTGEVRPATEFIAEATTQVVTNDNRPENRKTHKNSR